jgi:hypothetical protein
MAGVGLRDLGLSAGDCLTGKGIPLDESRRYIDGHGSDRTPRRYGRSRLLVTDCLHGGMFSGGWVVLAACLPLLIGRTRPGKRLPRRRPDQRFARAAFESGNQADLLFWTAYFIPRQPETVGMSQLGLAVMAFQVFGGKHEFPQRLGARRIGLGRVEGEDGQGAVNLDRLLAVGAVEHHPTPKTAHTRLPRLVQHRVSPHVGHAHRHAGLFFGPGPRVAGQLQRCASDGSYQHQQRADNQPACCGRPAATVPGPTMLAVHCGRIGCCEDCHVHWSGSIKNCQMALLRFAKHGDNGQQKKRHTSQLPPFAKINRCGCASTD